jgi:cellulose synthase/poly-beta-1,6-N-acetylglucosamine synthase-like glycosyltransferase
MPDEIIIADDGSGLETKKAVQEMQEAMKDLFPITHAWQEDVGFRKPRILNEAIRQSTGDYLIFIDGDCMAHRDFVRSHVKHSAPDAVLSGKRVEIGKELSEWLLKNGKVMNRFNLGLLRDAARNDPYHSRRVVESIPIKNKMLRRLMHRDRIYADGLWGCNFSLHKDLFIAINGCDEDFVDGSIEDNDIGIRVQNQGKKLRSVRGLAIIFHLWHKTTWSFENEKYQQNLAILKRRIANKEPVCKNGIRKL